MLKPLIWARRRCRTRYLATPLAALALGVRGPVAAAVAHGRGRTPPAVRPNANTEPAGALRNGVLTVALEARVSVVHLDGPDHPPLTVAAFAEPGREPVMPGPLVRARAGTQLRFSIRNSLPTALTFEIPATLERATSGRPDPRDVADSIVVPPRAVGTMTARAGAPGNYFYRAHTAGRAATRFGLSGVLAGAIVIDSTAAPHPRDRVFMIMETPDSALVACADTASGNPQLTCATGRALFTINGRSWPNTERIHASVGDSLHWRLINASAAPHPMHLHGFYYRVDGFETFPRSPDPPPARGQMVVTQLMPPFSTMSMTWSPDRPGNWLFHCHFAVHLQPDSLSASRTDQYLRDMVGLLLGTVVTGRAPRAAPGPPRPVRHVRLVAEYDGRVPLEHPHDLGPLDSVPSMHFVIDSGGHRVSAGRDFSPELDLVRGQPVAITIVNHLAEPTSVHWHGIELEDSYMDGVPGFSGNGERVTPAIAPSDSFVAYFTPPRAGTFIYHAHVDDVREEAGGLEGALIVRDPGAAASPDDHVVFLKGDAGDRAHPLEIDGSADPDTIVLHTGRAARFRVINLTTANPVPGLWLTARRDSAAQIGSDSLLVHWRVVAKDGFDLPEAERTPQPARRTVAVGETYDFEYTPRRARALRLEFRGSAARHPLLIRVPIRVQ